MVLLDVIPDIGRKYCAFFILFLFLFLCSFHFSNCKTPSFCIYRKFFSHDAILFSSIFYVCLHIIKMPYFTEINAERNLSERKYCLLQAHQQKQKTRNRWKKTANLFIYKKSYLWNVNERKMSSGFSFSLVFFSLLVASYSI